MHQHLHPYSYQHVPDDFTDYGPSIRAWQILPEIDVPMPSAVLLIVRLLLGNLEVWFHSGLVLGRLQAFFLEVD